MIDDAHCPRCGHAPGRPAPGWVSRIPAVGRFYDRFMGTACAEGVEGPSGWGEACGCSHPFHLYHLLEQRSNR